MNCGELKSLTDAFVDGELEKAAKSRMSDHLRECDSCRNRVEAARKTRHLVRSAVVKPEAPETLNRRIRSSIDGMRDGTV